MDVKYAPPVSNFILTSLILVIVGWGGLAALVMNTLPTVGPRWLFFFLLVLALTGSVLPVIAFFHRRFPGNPPPSSMAVLRQSIWVGIYGATLAWLQIGRVLTLGLALLLMLGMALIEFLLRLNERSQWKP